LSSESGALCFYVFGLIICHFALEMHDTEVPFIIMPPNLSSFFFNLPLLMKTVLYLKTMSFAWFTSAFLQIIFCVYRVDKENEIDCLIKGCNFLLKNIPNEAFMYHRNAEPQYVFQSADPNIFPYLLVNIGSGVSIMKVRSYFWRW